MAAELPRQVHLGHGRWATELELPVGAFGFGESINLRLYRSDGFEYPHGLTPGPAVLELELPAGALRTSIVFRQRIRSQAPYPVTLAWGEAGANIEPALRFVDRERDLPQTVGEIWQGRAATTGLFGFAGSQVSPSPRPEDLHPQDTLLEINPRQFDFGPTAPGLDSAVRFFRITHRGPGLTRAVRTALTGQPESAFGITSSTCFGALGPGQSCFVAVVFQPQGPGAARGQLEVTDDLWHARATLEGVAVRPSQLRMLTDELQFDVTAPGETRMQTLRLLNVGDVPLPHFALTVSGRDAEMFVPGKVSCEALPPNGSCEIPITFAPAQSGSFFAVIEARFAQSDPVRVAAYGRAATPPRLMPFPNRWDFGRVLLDSRAASKRIVIRNEGQLAARALKLLVEGADAQAFLLSEQGKDVCTGQTLPGAATCEVQLSFSPNRPGHHEAWLSLLAEGVVSTKLPLEGQGVNPVSVGADPTPLDFGLAPICPVNRSLTIRNLGGFPTGPVHLDAGSVPPCPPTQDRPPFCLVANRCAEALMPDASCTITFSFCPGVRGRYETQISVMAAPGGEVTVTLVGEAP